MSISYHNHLVYRTGRRVHAWGVEGSVSSFLNGRYKENVVIVTDHMQ